MKTCGNKGILVPMNMYKPKASNLKFNMKRNTAQSMDGALFQWVASTGDKYLILLDKVWCCHMVTSDNDQRKRG